MAVYDKAKAFELTTDEKRQRIEQQETIRKKAVSEKSRNFSEHVSDASSAIMGGSARLIRTGVGLADFTNIFNEGEGSTIDTLYDVTGDAVDFWDKQKSEPLSAQYEMADVRVEESYIKNVAPKLDQLRQEGWSEAALGISEQAAKFGMYIKEGVANPSIIFDQVLESTPEFLTGGVVGKALTKVPLKFMPAAKAKRFMAGPAGRKYAERMAEIGGVSTTVMSEGMNNAIDAKEQVKNMGLGELVNTSPEFQELIDNGKTPTEAREILADVIFNQTFLSTGALAGLISRYTGAGKRQGSVFNEAGGKGQRVKEIGKAGASEGIEEGLQGVVGQHLSNLALTRADVNQELTEGLGKAGAYGTLAGGAMGGSVATAKEGAAAVVEKAESGMRRIQEEFEKATQEQESRTETAETFQESGVEEAVESIQSESPAAQVAEIVKQFNEGTDSSQAQQVSAQIRRKLSEIENQFSEVEKNTDLSEDARIKEMQRVMGEYEQAEKVVRDFEINQAKNTIVDSDAVNETVSNPNPQKVDRILGSIKIEPTSLTVEQAQKLKDSKVLTPEQLQEIDDHIRTEQAISSVETQLYGDSRKNSQQVNQDVVSGGKGFKGIRNYQNNVNSLVVGGEYQAAEQEVKRLAGFTDRHAKKADDIIQAFEPYKDNKNAVLTEDEQQRIEAVKKSYNYNVTPNSNNRGFIDLLATEKDALRESTEQLKNTVIRGRQAVQKNRFTDMDSEIDNPDQTETVEEVTNEPADNETVQNTDTDIQANSEIDETITDANESTLNEATALEAPAGADNEGSTIPHTKVKNLTVKGEPIDSLLYEDKIYVSTAAKSEDGVKKLLGEVDSKFVTHRQLIAQVLNKAGYDSAQILKKVTDKNIQEFLVTYQNSRKELGIPEFYREFKKTKFQGNMLHKPAVINKEAEAFIRALQSFDVEPKDSFNLSQRLSLKPIEVSGIELKNYYYETNLIQQYFVEGSNPNLLTKVETPFVFVDQAKEYVAKELDVDELTEEQNKLVESFVNLNTDVDRVIDKIYLSKEVMKHNNLVSYLESFQGNLHPNIVSAITVSINNWINTSSQKSLLKTEAEVNQLLGNDDSTVLDQEVFNFFTDKGDIGTKVMEDLGKEILRTLNIKGSNNSFENIQTNLENSLGALAVAVMGELDLIESSRMATKEFQEMRGKSFSGNEKETTLFIKAKEGNTDNGLSPKLVDIKNTNQLGGNLITNLFSGSMEVRAPEFNPIKVVNTKVKKTNKKLTNRLEKVVQKEQSRAWKLKEDNLKIHDYLGEEKQLELYGFQQDYGNNHVTRQKKIEAKNAALVRSLDHLKDFRSSILQNSLVAALKGKNYDGEFYFNYRVVKQTRIMQDSNTFNVQSDKLHRHFAKLKEWEQEYSTDLNSEDYRKFALAVADSMDLDTDKRSELDVINDFKQIRDTKVVQEGIAAVVRTWNENNEEGDQDLIIKATKFINSDEMPYGLDGLVALAKHQQAVDNGESTFVSDLAREIDGLTNGPAIGVLQLMADKTTQGVKQKLSRMGIFFDATEKVVDHVSEEHNEDSYETLGNEWQKTLDELPDQVLVKNIKKLFGNISRKEAKDPLIQTNYGSGAQAIREQLHSNLVEKIYDQLEKIQKVDTVDGNNTFAILMYERLDREIADITGISNNFYGGENANELLLKDVSKNRLTEALDNTYGEALISAIDKEFGVFRENVKMINQTFGAIFSVYEKIYQERLESARIALEVEGEIISNTTGLPKQVIQEIQEELVDIEPILHNYFSKREELLEAGIELVKGNSEKNFEDSAYQSEVVFKTKVKNLNQKNMRVTGSTRKMSSPGAGPAVMGIHSVDAATMAMLLEETEALNIYDAIMVSAKNAPDKGKTINEKFLAVNRKHSIFGETVKAFNKTLEFLNESGNGDLKRVFEAGINEQEFGGYVSIKNFKEKLQSELQRNEKMKEQIYQDMTMSNQYVITGGEVFMDRENKAREGQIRKDVNEELDRNLNSARGFNPYVEIPQTRKSVQSSNSEQVFDDLGKFGTTVKETPEHRRYLKNLLKNSINQVMEPFKLNLLEKDDMENVGATDSSDMWIIAQIKNMKPNVSRMLSNGIRMSAQEIYLHELVHNVTRAGIDKKSRAQKQLERLWEVAKKQVTVEDFMADPEMDKNDPFYSREYEAAKRRYQHIFEPTISSKAKREAVSTGTTYNESRSDYLHEFMAFGMTNARFRELLSNIEMPTTKQRLFSDLNFSTAADSVKSVFTVMGQLFTAIAEAVAMRTYRLDDLSGDQVMDELFKQLGRIERQQKNKVLQGIERNSEKFLEKGNELALAIKYQISKAAGHKVFTESKSKVVAAGSRIVSQVTGKNPEVLGQAIDGYLNKFKQGKQGVMGDILTEVKGRTKDNGKFHDAIRATNVYLDHQRKNIKSSVTNALINHFGKKLEIQDKEAIHKAVIKTDMEILWKHYGLEELTNLMDQSDRLEDEIRLHENMLYQYNRGNFYVNQAKGLGWWLVSGELKQDIQMLNAGRIAQASGLNLDIDPTQSKAAEAIIDRLASLYGMRYTPKATMGRAKAVLNAELSRKDSDNADVENGFTYTMWQHRDLKRQAKARIFRGDPLNMIKGYTKEIMNPYIDVKYGTLDEKDMWLEQGYVMYQDAIKRDPNDGNGPDIYMFVSKHGGLNSFEAMIMSRTSRKAKGTNLRNIIKQDNPGVQPQQLEAATNKKLQRITKVKISNTLQQKGFDPLNAKGNFLAPVFDLKGNIVDWRYMMKERTKDDVLEKNNDFAENLGAMAGNIVDKTHTKVVNEKAIDALYEQYQYEFNERFNQYVSVGRNSPDSELRELYLALPDETKAYVKSVWGRDEILVRRDLVKVVFGQRKYSITDKWDLDTEDRNLFDKTFIKTAEMFLGSNTKGKIRSVENAWKEIIKDLKEVIVIKTFIITFMNTLSNALLLKVMGVPIKSIIKDQSTAFNSLKEYKKERAELLSKSRELRMKREEGVRKGRAKLKEDIARLENSLAANPVRELVESGVYQTIVEDLGDTDDKYSYKSKFAERVSDTVGFTDKLPKGVKDFFKESFVMQGSTMYTAANEFAQMSDFVARYALYKHYTDRKVNPLSKERAIASAMEIFINYELPTNQYVQYLNDIGLFWFSKYAFRVLKVLYRTMKDRPATVFGLMFLQDMFGGLPDIHDTSLNPLDRVQLPNFDAYSQIGPVSLVAN